MPHDVLTDCRVSEVVRGKARIHPAVVAKANTKTPRTAKPTSLVLSDKRSTFYVAPPAVDNVPGNETMLGQALRVRFPYLSNTVR
jgi:hypothetical protein